MDSLKAEYDQFSSLLYDTLTWVDEQAMEYIKLHKFYTVSRRDTSGVAAEESVVEGMRVNYQKLIMALYEPLPHKNDAEAPLRRDLKKKSSSTISGTEPATPPSMPLQYEQQHQCRVGCRFHLP